MPKKIATLSEMLNDQIEDLKQTEIQISISLEFIESLPAFTILLV